MWDSTALSPKILPAKCAYPTLRIKAEDGQPDLCVSGMECFFSESRMQFINATGLHSGGICNAPCGSLQSFPEDESPIKPLPPTRFRNPGGNTRLSNEINPTESTNQLIWTALNAWRPCSASSLMVSDGHCWIGSGGPGPLAFGNARLTDRRAGLRWLFCREECKQRDSNHAKDHNVLGAILPGIPCATACADMIVIVNPWARLDHAP